MTVKFFREYFTRAIVDYIPDQCTMKVFPQNTSLGQNRERLAQRNFPRLWYIIVITQDRGQSPRSSVNNNDIQRVLVIRGDYNSLTSDIFRSIWLNV